MGQALKNRLIGLLILTCISALSIEAQYKNSPVTLEGLINEQRTGRPKDKASRMIGAIRQSGVNFIVTPEIEKQLSVVGIKPEVIQAAKENYRLADGRRASFLTITANSEDTQFEIEGLASFKGDVTGYPLAPGTYRIIAKRTGYLTESQRTVVQPGASRNSVNFELKEAPVSVLVNEANGALQRGDHRIVRDLCQRIHLKDASNAKASKLLGQSYFMTREFDRSRDYYLRAIKGGEPIIFKIGRRDGVRTEFGILKLTANDLAFFNQKAVTENAVTESEIGDADAGFDVSYTRIRAAKLNNVKDGWRMELDVDILKGKKFSKKDFDMYLPSRGTSAYAAICGNCLEELNVIFKLIESLRSSN